MKKKSGAPLSCSTRFFFFFRRTPRHGSGAPFSFLRIVPFQSELLHITPTQEKKWDIVGGKKKVVFLPWPGCTKKRSFTKQEKNVFRRLRA